MMRVLRYYVALIRAELAAMAAYRLQIVVAILGWVVPFVMIALWRSAAADAPINGIAAEQFTSYFIGILVITSSGVTATLVFGLGSLIHSGQLSALLLRPFHPLHAIVARQLAENLVKLGPLLGVSVAVIWWLDGALSGQPIDWLIALVLALVGLVVSAYIGAIVGAAALWATKSEGFQGLVFGVEWILGGIIAPVSLLPLGLEPVARVLPFWLGLGAPSEMLAGLLTTGDGLRAVVLSGLWLVVLHQTLGLVWRRGMVRYEAVGA